MDYQHLKTCERVKSKISLHESGLKGKKLSQGNQDTFQKQSSVISNPIALKFLTIYWENSFCQLGKSQNERNNHPQCL